MALVSIYANELDPDIDDSALDVINEGQLGALQALMPTGPAWPTDLGLTLVELERALSYEFSRVQRRVGDLLNELYPNTVYELLADQERVWGLPDLCNQPTTVSGRRIALQAKMVGFSDPNIPDIELLASNLGYNVEVDAPVRTPNLYSCDSTCDDSLYGAKWMFWWRTIATSGANDQELECVLESYTPDHTLRSTFFTGWGNKTAAEANTWTGLCWSKQQQRYVAVSSDGTHRVMVSSDTFTWVTATAAEANSWSSVCWSPLLLRYVAVATSGTHRVMTSPDGFTWTVQTASEANAWNSVCWADGLSGGGKFVAVASSGTHRVMTSPDGFTWTNATAAEANSWKTVCWADDIGLLVAVSTDGTHRVMTSVDGATWLTKTAAEQSTWTSVCWSRRLQKLVAVCSSAATSGHYVMTSPDATTWTAQTAPANGWLSVCDVGKGFLFDGLDLPVVAVGSDPTFPSIMISVDAINWTAINGNGGFNACAWAPNYQPNGTSPIGYPACAAVGALTGSDPQVVSYLGLEV